MDIVFICKKHGNLTEEKCYKYHRKGYKKCIFECKKCKKEYEIKNKDNIKRAKENCDKFEEVLYD